MASSINIKSTDSIHYLGDSWTQTYNWAGFGTTVPNSLVERVNQSTPTGGVSFAPIVSGARAIVSGQAAILGNARPGPITSWGANGNNVTTFPANMAARCLSFNPDVVFFETGANDELSSLDPSPGGAYETAMRSVIDQFLAFKPSGRMLILTCLCLSEQTSAGTWTVPCTTVKARLAAICSSYSNVVMADTNTPALAYELANNPSPGAANGILTIDGIHPNTLGKQQVASWVMPYLTFS